MAENFSKTGYKVPTQETVETPYPTTPTNNNMQTNGAWGAAPSTGQRVDDNPYDDYWRSPTTETTPLENAMLSRYNTRKPGIYASGQLLQPRPIGDTTQAPADGNYGSSGGATPPPFDYSGYPGADIPVASLGSMGSSGYGPSADMFGASEGFQPLDNNVGSLYDYITRQRANRQNSEGFASLPWFGPENEFSSGV